jgi:hypothetical protein
MPCDVWCDVVPPDAKFTESEFWAKWNELKVMLWSKGYDYTLSPDGSKIRKNRIHETLINPKK